VIPSLTQDPQTTYTCKSCAKDDDNKDHVVTLTFPKNWQSKANNYATKVEITTDKVLETFAMTEDDQKFMSQLWTSKKECVATRRMPWMSNPEIDYCWDTKNDKPKDCCNLA
jgi:hypothetical protein